MWKVLVTGGVLGAFALTGTKNPHLHAGQGGLAAPGVVTVNEDLATPSGE
ncbi:MAG: hypothetical protein AAF848_13080 [Pseudomonadota bacterium]